jgi:hypothetical protein
MKKQYGFRLGVGVGIGKVVVMILMVVAGVSAEIKRIAIIDAGSSGSRLLVYEVEKENGTIKSIYSKKVEPGLDSLARRAFPDDSSSLVDSINSLLSSTAFIKKNNSHANKGTKVYILATAGMRMVDSEKAGTAYRYITNWANQGNYNLCTAMTISGRYEGFYAWIAAGVKGNKLTVINEKFDKNQSSLNFGIVEIGGASMQQAYGTNKSEDKCKNGDDVWRDNIGCVYSKSYLGWGINQIELTDGNIKSTYEKSTGKHVPSLEDDKAITTWYALGGGFHKGTENTEKKLRSEYKNKLFNGKSSLGNLSNKTEPDLDAQWTRGAALDILLNSKKPKEFNYGAQD